MRHKSHTADPVKDPNLANGLKIKATRNRLGMSQLAFSALIPVDRAYLSELENGRQTIQEWHLDKAEKIEREHGESLGLARGAQPARRPTVGASDLPLVVEIMVSGLEEKQLLRANQRIDDDDRISASAKAVCAKVLIAKSIVAASAAAKLPGKIHGVSSKLSAAQRGAAKKQQALGRRGSRAS